MHLEIIDLHAETNPSKIERLFISWQQTFKSEHERLEIPFYTQRFWDSRFKINIIDKEKIVASLGIEPHIFNHRFSEKKFHYLQDKKIDNKLKELLSQGCIFEQLFVSNTYRKNFDHRIVDILIGCGYELMKKNAYNSMAGIARADKNIDKIALQFGAKVIHSIELNNTPCSFIYTLNNEIKTHPLLAVQQHINQLWTTAY